MVYFAYMGKRKELGVVDEYRPNHSGPVLPISEMARKAGRTVLDVLCLPIDAAGKLAHMIREPKRRKR